MTRFVTPAMVFACALALSGCGGGSPPTVGGPTESPGGTAGATNEPGDTPTPVEATTEPTPPAEGGDTVTVSLEGMAEAGPYTGGANPNCSYNFLGKGVWAVAYVDNHAAATQVGVANVIAVVSTQDETDKKFSVGVTVGPPGGGGGSFSFDRKTGTGSMEVTDTGTSAVIHVIAQSAEGVQLDMTVNCPIVSRGA